MRPRKITIEGINSFIDRQELDFEAVGRRNLFCICGPTGAGKSTIFDSIILALYGKGSKGSLADTVNLSCTSGSVAFEFEANGDIYRAERTVKCRDEKNDKGEPTGKRLAMNTDCMLYKNGAVAAKGSDDVTAAVKGIIGMDDDEFKNVYLLEQGEYAAFLKKQPAKQLETVGKIFSLMRFGDVYKLAGEKKKEADIHVENTKKRIDDLGDVGSDDLRAAKKELASLKSKSAALSRDAEAKEKELDALGKTRDLYLKAAEKQKTVADHAARLDEANEKLKSAAAQEKAFSETDNGDELKARINGLREKQNELIALNAIDRECAAATADCDKKAVDLQRKAAAAQNAEAALKQKESAAEADKQVFDSELKAFIAAADGATKRSDVLANAVTALKADDVSANAVTECYYELRKEKEAYDELIEAAAKTVKEADDRAKKGSEALKRAETIAAELSRAEDDLKAAVERESEAEAALAKARIASHAAAVSAELKIGDRCPVCGGVYNGGEHESGDVELKKKEKDDAERTRKQAEKKVAELKNLLDSGNAEYARIAREEEELREKAKELNEKAAATCVTDIYNEMLTVLSRAKSCGEKSEKSKAAYGAAVPTVAAARAEVAAAQKALEEAKEKAAELCEKLGDMRGKTDAEVADVKKKIEAAEKEAAAHDEKKRALAAEKEAAKATVKAVEELLAAARADCPTDLPEFDEDEYKAKQDAYNAVRDGISACNADIARREAELAALEQKLEKLKSLKAERDGYQKQSDIYKTISDMTKGKAMLNFVATEYIQDFTANASNILAVLSAGKYTMEYDSENGFVVSDYLNDGKMRRTGTLSGGEMFLASLAVAIAISHEQNTDEKGFFFLDEGFGTLDDDLIDTVYAALEGLAKNCLVGVISHSNSLIDLMPARVDVISATDTVGSKIKY
ncbi:MAG: SMC family ATPase [Clostridiales bacterium]|nr:SMC family ATPase [Clostridiales bacterium]